jgi:hypothetical protein
MNSRFIGLGLATDPWAYADAHPVPLDAGEEQQFLTYRSGGPDYGLLVFEFLLEGGLEAICNLVFLGLG